jgi:hypothetical protein
MRYSAILSGALLSSAILFGAPGHSPAFVASPSALLPAVEDNDLTVPVARRGGAAVRGGGAAVHRGGAVRGGGAAVRGGAAVTSRTVVRGGAVARGGGVYRSWVRRPYYGTVVAGVTLGTIVAATTAPAAPSSEVCWYWANSGHTRGYWDRCN